MAMDFFEDQRIARKKTGRLVLLFILAMACIMVLVYFAAVATMGYVIPQVAVHMHHTGGGAGMGPSSYGNGYGGYVATANNAPFVWWRPMILIGAVIGTLLVVGLCCGYRIAQLRADGGAGVAASLGGKLLSHDTADKREKRLLNVVEEMAIASGTAVPPVYVLQEGGINAFAAGFTPNTAVIAVTQGALDQLSRDQLQGVIGHEFSHILNGDMRLNIRLIGVIFGIIALSLLGSILLRAIFFSGGGGSRRDDRGGGNAMIAIAAFGLLLIVIGYIGSLFGKLIQAAVSRQREFLADASSVQFTRNPQGIAGALKVIGGYSRHARLDSPHAQQVAHMCFGQASGMAFGGPFATHPPLKVRIKRIDPSFDGQFPEVQDYAALDEDATSGTEDQGQMRDLSGASLAERIAAARHGASRGGADGRAALGQGLLTGAITAAALGSAGGGPTQAEPGSSEDATHQPSGAASSRIGRPTTAHLAYAQQLINDLPQSLRDAARDPYGARAVIFTLLIDEENNVRQAQLGRLQANAESHVYALVNQLLSETTTLNHSARLPLLDMAVPALRKLSPRQYDEFKENVKVLIHADDKVSLFEWVLQRTILRRLEPYFGHEKPAAVRYRRLSAVAEPCVTLMSALARIGADDQEQARHAFEAAAKHLGMDSGRMTSSDQCSYNDLDESLMALAQLTPELKRRVIDAAAAAVVADKTVTMREVELLRAICDSLDAPMPPLLT